MHARLTACIELLEEAGLQYRLYSAVQALCSWRLAPLGAVQIQQFAMQSPLVFPHITGVSLHLQGWQ